MPLEITYFACLVGSTRWFEEHHQGLALQEFYVLVPRKFDPPLSRKEARELVSNYGEWKLVRIDMLMIVNASELEEKHQLTFWDALIIEATRRSGATRLISEDIQSATTIEGIAIENPFDVVSSG